MADYLEVVEYLRDLRSSPITQVTDELRHYAAQYAELCRSANERLRRCTVFLNQGLRSEAMQLASEPPNLLDLVAALDLPDAAQWAEICQQHDLPLPPPLQMDRAALLNEAYNQEQSLEELFDQHRLLALARAPLKGRLAVMRQIAALDPGNPLWESDIREMERARIKEMRIEYQQAMHNKDPVRVSELQSEIEQSTWLEPVPQDLRQAVNDAFTLMVQSDVEKQLRHKVDRLREAYAARDYDQCAALLSQIRQTYEGSGLQFVSHPLAQELAPISQWVKQEAESRARQQTFAAACTAFVKLLESSPRPAEAAEALARLQSSGNQPPAQVLQRYQQYLQQYRATSRRRHLVRLSAVATVIAVALAALFYVLQYQAAENWAQRLRDANNAMNVQLARQLIDELERRAPRLRTHPSLVVEKERTARLEQQQATDRQSLAGLLERIGPIAATARQTALNAEDPQALLAAAANVGNALGWIEREGKPLAWVDADHRLAAAVGELQNLQRELRTRALALVRQRTDALRQRLDAIAADADVEAALASLDSIADALPPLQALETGDGELRPALAALASRIEQQRQDLLRNRRMRQLVAALRGKTWSADTLKQQLTTFVTELPNTPLAVEFASALERLPLARSVEVWEGLLRGWGALTPATPAEARQRAEAVAAYTSAYPTSPFAAHTPSYLAYLKQAAAVLGERGSWREALGDMLSNPLLCDLSYMMTSDGRKYYTIGNPNERLIPQVGRAFDAIDPKNPAQKIVIHVRPPLRITTTQPVRVAHAAVAVRMADEIRQIDENTWDTWGIEAIEKLALRDDIEPAVQGILLQQMIKTNQQIIGWAVPSAYERADAALARVELDSLVWYDPERPVTEGTNQAIRQAIARLPSAAEVKQKYLARRNEMLARLDFRASATGLLLRNDSGAWEVFTAGEPAEDAVAWAVAPADSPAAPSSPATTAPSAQPAPAALVPLAVVKGGRFVVDGALARYFPEGTMVFLVKRQ